MGKSQPTYTKELLPGMPVITRQLTPFSVACAMHKKYV